MSFARHGLVRCYLEAGAIWFAGNALIGWFSYFRAALDRNLRPRPWSFFESLADPGFLIANALMILLFAAILRGMRKPTGRTE